MPPAEEELLDGVPLADWHVFIDKNASRYMELFQKHKDKMVFFHMNWAAMFFNVYWMFYRKMYKYALFFMAAWLLFILAVSTVALVALKPDVEAADRILAPYSQYLEENDGQLYGDIAVVEQVQAAQRKYNKAMNAVTGKLTFTVLVCGLLFTGVFGLLVDCLYRSYVRRRIRHTSGGTSGWSLVAGVVVYQAFTHVIESPLLTLLVTSLWG